MVGLEITIVKAHLEFLILLPLHSGMTLSLAPKGFSSTFFFSRSDHLSAIIEDFWVSSDLEAAGPLRKDSLCLLAICSWHLCLPSFSS